MAVAEQVPSAVIIASGDTTVFPYPFLVQTADDMVATVDSVEFPVGYYSVTGLGQLAGGNVIFGSAPVQGARVVLERRTKLTRSTVFDDVGDFRASVLNADLDRPMLALQEAKAKSDRVVTLAAGDAGIELAALDGSEGKVLGVLGGELGFIFVPGGADAVLDSLAAQDGANLVGFLQAGTGAIRRTQQSKSRDFYSPKDFGAVGNGAHDDTQAVVNAHASGERIEYPAGRFVVAAGAVFLPTGGFRGAGPDRTFIVCPDPTGDLFTYNGQGQVSYNGGLRGPSFEGVSIVHSATRTSGADLRMAPVGGEISFPTFDNIVFDGGWDALDASFTSHASFSRLRFINNANRSLTIANTNNADSGDSGLDKCLFNWGAIFPGEMVGIYQTSQGGLRILNSKFNGGKYHYYMAAVGTLNVADFLMSGCSLENALNKSVVFTRMPGSTMNWGSLNILGNQFANNPFSVDATDPSGFLSDLKITGNTFGQLGASHLAVAIDYVSGFDVSANKYSGSGGSSGGVSIGSHATGSVDERAFTNVGNAIVNMSPTALVNGQQRGTVNVTTGTPYAGLFASAAVPTAFPIPYPTGYVPTVTVTIGSTATGGVSTFISQVTNLGFNAYAIGQTNGASVPVFWQAS